jgi:hypothetical protein
MALLMPMALFVLFKSQGALNWLPRPTLDSFPQFARYRCGVCIGTITVGPHMEMTGASSLAISSRDNSRETPLLLQGIG